MLGRGANPKDCGGWAVRVATPQARCVWRGGDISVFGGCEKPKADGAAGRSWCPSLCAVAHGIGKSKTRRRGVIFPCSAGGDGRGLAHSHSCRFSPLAGVSCERRGGVRGGRLEGAGCESQRLRGAGRVALQGLKTKLGGRCVQCGGVRGLAPAGAVCGVLRLRGGVRIPKIAECGAVRVATPQARCVWRGGDISVFGGCEKPKADGAAGRSWCPSLCAVAHGIGKSKTRRRGVIFPCSAGGDGRGLAHSHSCRFSPLAGVSCERRGGVRGGRLEGAGCESQRLRGAGRVALQGLKTKLGGRQCGSGRIPPAGGKVFTIKSA